MTQTLDNLRTAGVLDIIQYLDRLPDHLIPRKDELIEELKKTRSSMQMQAPKKQHVPISGSLSADKVLALEPAQIQASYESLPKTARRAIVKKGNI